MGPPKTVTVEDSFKACPSIEAARRVVQVLAPDLLARLEEEHEVDMHVLLISCAFQGMVSFPAVIQTGALSLGSLADLRCSVA